jgi:hypothetical protein
MLVGTRLHDVSRYSFNRFFRYVSRCFFMLIDTLLTGVVFKMLVGTVLIQDSKEVKIVYTTIVCFLKP